MTVSWQACSIRVRLTLWYAGALALILILYAAGVFLFVRSSLSTELDRRLREDFEVAEDLLERTSDRGIQWRTRHQHEDEASPDSGRWVEVWDLNGVLLHRNSPGAGAELGFIAAEHVLSQNVSESIRVADSRVRVLSGRYAIGGQPVVIRVARSEESMWHELRELLLAMGLGLPLAVGLAGFGGYMLARGALAPVSAMADRARQITVDRLHERLPIENPDDELGNLAIAFNETFARLEHSFEQLRRFTADASHELRTPLTAIRSVGEVALREERSPLSYREVIGSMLEEADRLARLADSLLTLSRAETGHLRLSLEEVDLVELVRQVSSHLGVLAEEKRQVISIEGTTPVSAKVDRLVIRQALVNLLDNAIKHSPEGARIRVVVGDQGDAPAVEIMDQGPGIGAEHLEHIFDRFYRVDKARSREQGGAGLGLSIARWAVEIHGGHIEVESTVGKGTTFRVVLPKVKLDKNP
jgi:heavy metal sensor kinase